MMKGFSLTLVLAGLALASSATAQTREEVSYVECFDEAAPADIAALNLQDYLSELRRGPEPEREFWDEFEAAWGTCADSSWSEDQDVAARSYMMNLIGLRGSRAKITSFGISEPYLKRLTDMGRVPSNDGIWTDEVETQYLAEVDSGAIDDEEARIFVEIVVMYVGSLRDLSSGPPAL